MTGGRGGGGVGKVILNRQLLYCFHLSYSEHGRDASRRERVVPPQICGQMVDQQVQLDRGGHTVHLLCQGTTKIKFIKKKNNDYSIQTTFCPLHKK